MDDLVKQLNQLETKIKDLIPEWVFDQAERIDTIVTALPDDIPDALTIISVAIDIYAAKQHLKSSEVWKLLTELAADVRKEIGDYE